MDGPEKPAHPFLYFKPTAACENKAVGKKQQSNSGKNRSLIASYPEFFGQFLQKSQSSPNTYYHKKMEL